MEVVKFTWLSLGCAPPPATLADSLTYTTLPNLDPDFFRFAQRLDVPTSGPAKTPRSFETPTAVRGARASSATTFLPALSNRPRPPTALNALETSMDGAAIHASLSFEISNAP